MSDRTAPSASADAAHPNSVFAVHEIGPFLRSLTRSGETLHEADIRGIEAAIDAAIRAERPALDVERLHRAIVRADFGILGTHDVARRIAAEYARLAAPARQRAAG